ncbi:MULTISPECIES: hypothetical protein [Neorhizobium]|uniref:hypothetical protein n=1 Tax=Neorhizobium TaxID=1525371 RepID=UPI001FDEFCAB|nr:MULTISPECIES: hypothetical protein [Neorhizobium]
MHLRSFTVQLAVSLVLAVAAHSFGRAQSPPSSPETRQLSPASLPKIAAIRPGFDAKLLEPVQGVAFRTYGHVTYGMFLDPNGNHEAIFQTFGIDRTRFEAANATFTDRMKQDPTFTMVEMFGGYFAETAQGTYAALGRDIAQSVLNQAPLQEQEPMAEDKFREIQVFYGRKASVAGTELAKQDEVLKPYHITFNDFNIMGAWFSRRLALQSAGLSNPSEMPQAQAEDAPKERPEWGGMWRFSWKTLQRTETAMKIVEATSDMCIKQGMTAETLPLMPNPSGVKCVLLDTIHFYDSGVQIDAQCDHGGIGASWGLYLQPDGDGQNFSGQISYNQVYEGDQDMPQPTTDITVKRIGDCP